MRKFTAKQKLVAGLGAGAFVVAGGGAAYAYWSSTGTGSGSATVGSATNFTVGQLASPAPTGGPLYPDASIGVTGGHVQTNSYKVTNPGSGSENLNKVVISVAKSDGTAWSSQTDSTKPACTASDFSVGGQAVNTPWTDTSLAGDYTAGSSQTGTVTVELIDNGHNQDNCQGVTVPLYFSAS